ncbi:hypothetical protein CHS0354_004450 [Potamilus streckersoni]|uniref:Uncharacterized protein n=1 Tax=Potamilus streckersoni TaxID=2493646 RepID=A0AAE0SP73_9BIVA|nr:hypothetical protein CHS0354_004450 [Potamilus streckersoni]
MSSAHFKRPSSARRNIRQETFSPFVSGTRLRNVQELLNDGTRASTDFPDAILCISGIDSRYNDGTSELLNYLLFGFFELRKTELEKSGFDEEVIDDILILIQRNRVDVYCNSVNYYYLLPYVSHWQNVFFHCLTDEESEDQEAVEDFKITTFVSIVKDLKKVGIPFSSSGHLQTFDKFAIEKWPIIQAYAVEGVGGGGFFTMKHEVVDISKDLQKIYQLMDPVVLEMIMCEHLPRFERQWNTLLSTLNIDISFNAQALTEDKVCEPLKSYFAHGQVGGGGDCESKRFPFVVFGPNSERENLQTVINGGKSSNINVKYAGLKGANFMICHGVSPKGPISCSRTYFITQFKDLQLEDDRDELVNRGSKDMSILTHMYCAMIDAVEAGINTYSCTLSVTQASNKAEEVLIKQCSSMKDSFFVKYLQSRPQISFIIEAVDNMGNCHKVDEGKRSLLIKTAMMTVYDIPSSERMASKLGSLMFSESFQDSVLKVQTADGQIRLETDVLLLTDHIPRFQAWSVDNSSQSTRLLEILNKDSLGKFGKLIMAGEPAYIGSETSLSYPPEEANLYVYENGLIVSHPNIGATALHGSQLKSASFFDGDSPSIVALLVLEYKSSMISRLPPHLQSQSMQIVLAFTPKTKASKLIFSEVLHQWKTESEMPPLQTLEDVPEKFKKIHAMLQHRYETANPRSKVSGVTALRKCVSSLPSFYRFLTHFEASSVVSLPIPEKDLSIILKRTGELASTQESEDMIIVTVLVGLPWSHNTNLCDVLAGLNKEQNRWVVLKQPVGSVNFNAADIQASLKATLNAHRRRKASQGDTHRNTRVLYIPPGFSDIVDVVQAIVCHPDPDVRAHCKIGSVAACIDPLNAFMEHKYTFPMLLNQCTQGFVNQIVFTSVQNRNLSILQELLRCANTDVSYILAEKGQITRSPDIDTVLSETAFNLAEKVRSRNLISPGWYLSRKTASQATGYDTVRLSFKRPLDKSRLVESLKGLKGSLVPYPFWGNIYFVQGKFQVVGSDDDQELQFVTLSNSLSLLTAGKSTMGSTQGGGFVLFLGVGLDEKRLRDWLRNCAPQKPNKRDLITRKSVTKEDIQKIHVKRHLDSLPEGWFYNGTQYISFSGDKQDTHPSLEQFIEEYIQEKNNVIQEYNRKNEEASANFTDLFS